MSDINVMVVDQQMTITNNPVIASGGVNEDYVVFDFSSEWDNFEKVACFYKDGDEENIVEVLIDQNNKALIPHEVTDEPGKFWFGVVGINGEITYTSEVLWYDLRKGIYEKESRGATADIYVQMLQLAQEIVNHLNNTPYITAEEDGEFVLPIHTINDSQTSANSTWSSNKINEITTNVIYNVGELEGTEATCNLTYDKIVELILNNNFNGEIVYSVNGSTGSAEIHVPIDECQVVSGRSGHYLIITAEIEDYKCTIMHYSGDNISISWTNSDIDELQSDVADLQSKQVEVIGEAITFSTDKAILSFLNNVNCQVSIPASSMAGVRVVGLDTTKYPATDNMNNVLVFVTRKSGNADVIIETANLSLYDNQWWVYVALKSFDTNQVSFQGELDIMLVDMRNAAE